MGLRLGTFWPSKRSLDTFVRQLRLPVARLSSRQTALECGLRLQVNCVQECGLDNRVRRLYDGEECRPTERLRVVASRE